MDRSVDLSTTFSFTLEDEVTALRRQKEVVRVARCVALPQSNTGQELTKMVKGLQIQLAAEQHRLVHQQQKVFERCITH